MRLNSLLLVFGVLSVFGNTALGQRDPPAQAPRLFSLPNKNFSSFEKFASPELLHQMQYREVDEYLRRFYYNQESLARLPAGEAPADLDTDEKRDQAIRDMVNRLGDRWTIYRSPDDLLDGSRRNLVGDVYLGLMLDAQADGTWLVAYVSGASAAYRGGLRRGDQIISIAGTELAGLSKDEVDALQYAQPGDVAVSYKVDGKTFSTKLKLRNSALVLVTAKSMDDLWYFHVQNFSSEKVLSEFATKAAELNRANGKPSGIILDMRGNHGGLMEVAYQFVSVFVKQGKIGEHISRQGRLSYRTSIEAQSYLPTLLEPTKENLQLFNTLQTAPLVVLTDGSTISASEMVTSALKGSKRATVLGTTTWGKGVSFHQLGLSSGGQLQVCTGFFVGPDGLDHRDKGIAPNVVVQQPRKSARDVQLDAAVAYLNGHSGVKAKQPRDDSGEAAAIFALFVMFAFTAVLTVMLARRSQLAAARRRRINSAQQDEQFAQWVNQLEPEETFSEVVEDDDPLERELPPPAVNSADLVLNTDHFMVGAKCHGCDHRFLEGETVVEVFTSAGGQYVCCQACRPLELNLDDL